MESLGFCTLSLAISNNVRNHSLSGNARRTPFLQGPRAPLSFLDVTKIWASADNIATMPRRSNGEKHLDIPLKAFLSASLRISAVHSNSKDMWRQCAYLSAVSIGWMTLVFAYKYVDIGRAQWAHRHHCQLSTQVGQLLWKQPHTLRIHCHVQYTEPLSLRRPSCPRHQCDTKSVRPFPRPLSVVCPPATKTTSWLAVVAVAGVDTSPRLKGSQPPLPRREPTIFVFPKSHLRRKSLQIIREIINLLLQHLHIFAHRSWAVREVCTFSCM